MSFSFHLRKNNNYGQFMHHLQNELHENETILTHLDDYFTPGIFSLGLVNAKPLLKK